jgi:hypothetical protein
VADPLHVQPARRHVGGDDDIQLAVVSAVSTVLLALFLRSCRPSGRRTE